MVAIAEVNKVKVARQERSEPQDNTSNSCLYLQSILYFYSRLNLSYVGGIPYVAIA